MQGHSSPPYSEEPSIVKAALSPGRIRLFLFGGSAIFAICLLLFFAPPLVFNSWGGPTLHLAYYGTVATFALFSLLVVVGVGIRATALKRLEPKRQRAAYGDRGLLAQIQPPPDEHALNVPFTLCLRYQPALLLKNVAIFLLFAVLCTVSLFLPDFFGVSAFANPLIAAVAIFCLFYAGLQLVQLVRRIPPYQLTITHDEIIVSDKTFIPTTRRVAWKDARLFTIVSLNSTYGSLYPLLFEVASADTVLRFAWLRPESAQRNPLQPQTSYEEYERQMHGILSVIAAKTGLPLYDLRKA